MMIDIPGVALIAVCVFSVVSSQLNIILLLRQISGKLARFPISLPVLILG